MNSRATPSKLSNIKRTMNKLIYLIFAVQVFFCVVSLVAPTMTSSPISATTWAAAPTASCIEEEEDYSDLNYFFTFFILYNNLIPCR
jgi:hypothetical protein